MRLAQIHVWPDVRNLHRMAPGWSSVNEQDSGTTRAWNTTFNGLFNVSVVKDDKRRVTASFYRHSFSSNEWKPTHRWNETWTHFFRVEADMLYNDLATAVEPVNETFRTILLSHISRPTCWTFFCVVTMLMTPSGIPARRESYINNPSVVVLQA